MQLVLEVPDIKAPAILEVLRAIKFVKVKAITPQKALLLQEIAEAVENMNLVKKGKLTAKPARELLNEL